MMFLHSAAVQELVQKYVYEARTIGLPVTTPPGQLIAGVFTEYAE